MDKTKWDKKYSGNRFLYGKSPNQFLSENIHLLPKGRVLDIAAGEGRNSVFFAKNGFTVDTADISKEGLKKAVKLAHEEGIEINVIEANLENYIITSETYDVIANFYYLQRDLVPQIKRGLKNGGAVIFETYIREQCNLPGGPNEPDYLLEHNELLNFFIDLRIIFYREGIFIQEDKKKAIASIIAIKTEEEK